VTEPPLDVVDADALAVVLAALNAHPGLLEAFGHGGPFASARNEPPYPHVRLTDTPGGAERTLDWLTAQELTVETHGDLDGSPGKARLRELHVRVLQVIRDLPKQPQDHPVVTGVSFPGARGYVPEPTGQPRYLSRVQVAIHP
jgi:hypothetical protein